MLVWVTDDRKPGLYLHCEFLIGLCVCVQLLAMLFVELYRFSAFSQGLANVLVISVSLALMVK